jgi:hypothetical protein
MVKLGMERDIASLDEEAAELVEAGAALLLLLSIFPSAASIKDVTAACDGGLMTKTIPADYKESVSTHIK